MLPVRQSWLPELNSRRCQQSNRRRTGKDGLLVVIYGICPLLSLLWRRVWDEVTKIAWFDWDNHFFFAEQIVVITYAISRVVARFSKSCIAFDRRPTTDLWWELTVRCSFVRTGNWKTTVTVAGTETAIVIDARKM